MQVERRRVKRLLPGFIVVGLTLTLAACGGSGGDDDAPAAGAPTSAATTTPDIYATATAYTAAGTPTQAATIALAPDTIPNSAAGKQLAWVMQFFFSIDPTQLDPQDITPRFTEEFLTALPVERLTASIKTFIEQHGNVAFTGFVAPPAETELAGYLRTSSGERFIIRIRVEEVSPYRMEFFRVEPAPR